MCSLDMCLKQPLCEARVRPPLKSITFVVMDIQGLWSTCNGFRRRQRWVGPGLCHWSGPAVWIGGRVALSAPQNHH